MTKRYAVQLISNWKYKGTRSSLPRLLTYFSFTGISSDYVTSRVTLPHAVGAFTLFSILGVTYKIILNSDFKYEIYEFGEEWPIPKQSQQFSSIFILLTGFPNLTKDINSYRIGDTICVKYDQIYQIIEINIE